MLKVLLIFINFKLYFNGTHTQVPFYLENAITRRVKVNIHRKTFNLRTTMAWQLYALRTSVEKVPSLKIIFLFFISLYIQFLIFSIFLEKQY